MPKLRISPSTIRESGRCEYAAAMKFMKNPATGKRWEPAFSDSARDNMDGGIFFEECLTGKRHVPRENDRGSYSAWLAKTQESTLATIRLIANKCKKYFLFDKPHGVGVKLEHEFQHFILNGELDYKGWVNDQHPLNPVVSEGVWDIKFTGDVTQTWDLGGTTPFTQIAQVPIYCLIESMNNSENPQLFYDAVELALAGRTAEARQKAEDWTDCTRIVNGGYFIAENRKLPRVRNKDHEMVTAEPIPLIIRLKHTAIDFLNLYDMILRKNMRWSDFRMSMNRYDPKLHMKVNASQHKCLGVGRMLQSKGRCPHIFHCPYGRLFLGGGKDFDINDLMES